MTLACPQYLVKSQALIGSPANEIAIPKTHQRFVDLDHWIQSVDQPIGSFECCPLWGPKVKSETPPSLEINFIVEKKYCLKVPYYTLFHQYIIGLRYIKNMSLKCLAPNTKQIIAASHNPLCFSPVSKVLILCLLL